MNQRIIPFCLTLLLSTGLLSVYSQNIDNKTDSSITIKNSDTSRKIAKVDTSKKVKSIASKAALRSALLPGLGQVYNKKYWKVPIVYGALAIPVSLFSYNRIWYKKTRFAFSVRTLNDSANFPNIDPQLEPLSTPSLKLYRNEFRKNMDFSVIGLLLLWGINIVDATVDGHMRTFDISDEITLGFKPTVTNNLTAGGVSLILSFKQKDNHSKIISF